MLYLLSPKPLALGVQQRFFLQDLLHDGPGVFFGQAVLVAQMVDGPLFFGIHMAVQNPVGLLLAALLSLRNVRFAATYRTIFFLPTLLSVVIIGFVWQLIL